jgi:flagellar hook-associated protein 1 FlgK
MQDFAIALSGLRAAQTALDVVGNNVANAATDGYHRQRVEFSALDAVPIGNVEVGAGVSIAGVTRMIDTLLESEIRGQQSAYEQTSQELSVLGSVEISFNEFSDADGLNATLDAFFEALQGLAAHPQDRVWQNETISTAQTAASEFRRLRGLMTDLEDQIVLEARNTTDSINSLVTQIAELNGKIQSIEISGQHANNLRDQRDSLIVELAKLADTETVQREYGVVDVSIGRLAVVTGSMTRSLEACLQSDGSLAVSVEGDEAATVSIQSGRLGGLLSLKNDLLAGFESDLDTLARAVISQVNRYHVQGLGQDGSFQQLTGWPMNATDLSATGTPVTDGTFFLRLTDTTTGLVERHAIDVNVSGPTPDTLDSIAAKLDAIDGLSASVVSSRLQITADPGYTFDFLPALLSEPTAMNLTAGSPPTVAVSGLYNGADNQTFTFRVTGSGSVGNGLLRLDVTDAAGETVTTINIGAGYAAGDTIELDNGIKISLSLGQVNDGDSFEVEALATADTSGFLAAAGMNTFFSGSGALDMEVCSEIADSPGRIATALGADLTDNTAALKLAGVREEAVESLDGMTPSQYYHRIVADLGMEVSLKQSRQENIEAMIQNLEQRRNEISSVNVNDEAAQLLVFEKMFQAVAKYLSSIQTTLTTMMDLI